MNKLTVVICYYNKDYFFDTLKSLNNQTNKNFVVFVGDDNSPNSPSDILREFPDLEIHYEKFSDNLGGADLTNQWKRCLEYVETDWFMILGDDDYVSENTVEEFYKVKNQNSDLNVFRLSMQRIDGQGVHTGNKITYTDLENSTVFFEKKAKGEVLSSLGEFIFSYKLYLKHSIRSYPKAFYSDNLMVLQYSNFSVIKNIEKAIAYIRVSEKSFSGNTDNTKSSNTAHSQYYYDLVTEFHEFFTTNQLNIFSTHIVWGFVKGYLKINIIDLLKVIFNNKNIIFLPKYYILKVMHKLNSR